MLIAIPVFPTNGLAQEPETALHSFTCHEGRGNEAFLLQSRIGAPAPEVIEVFSGSGASDISEHVLTQSELAQVNSAYDRLPSLYREVLQTHLRRLSFLDLQPGSGSALTSKVETGDESPQFDITLRASLLDEGLTTFLNTKPRDIRREPF